MLNKPKAIIIKVGILIMKLYLQCYHLLTTYLWYKNKSQYEGGANEKPSADEGRKCIDKIFHGIGSDNNDCEDNASHIGGCCDILGIINALDLHLAS